MFSEILEEIKKYDDIVIYRHQRPDGDAVFSSFALFTFLKTNFKGKNIQMYGTEVYDLMPFKNTVDTDTISKSLAIVLDTANTARIDNDTYKLAAKVIKIDHHPNIDPFGDINYVDESASATCQIVAEILMSDPFKDCVIEKDVAEYLYCGLLTDTLNFKTTNTSAKTLLIASKLVEIGNLKPSELSNLVFNKSLDEFEKVTSLRKHLKVKDNVGYLILNQSDLDKMHLSMDEAKNQIAEFGNIRELNIWAIFAYDSLNHKYNGSLRSKREYVINEIASRYNGGGHKNACGVKNLSRTQVSKLLIELINLSKSIKTES
ncbi:MAG: bifunctional oligoribonuclease/PAP phosphatase NrnA [Solobacterium sp.]|nr:bifunctional oligoribonuclease/PAP phosphatase NrnA [Solobacterium sp.]